MINRTISSNLPGNPTRSPSLATPFPLPQGKNIADDRIDDLFHFPAGCNTVKAICCMWAVPYPGSMSTTNCVHSPSILLEHSRSVSPRLGQVLLYIFKDDIPRRVLVKHTYYSCRMIFIYVKRPQNRAYFLVVGQVRVLICSYYLWSG